MKKVFREILAIFFLTIHRISNSKNDGVLSIYFHNPSKKLFLKLVQWLVRNKYVFISGEQLELIITTKTKTDRLVYVSFDDGWNGNLQLLEIIEKYKIPVTIFIPTQAIIDGNFWFEYTKIKKQQTLTNINKTETFKSLPFDELSEKVQTLKKNFNLKRSCITLDELKQISQNKFVTIGSHTVSHPILIRCSYKNQEYELNNSKLLLSEWTGKEVKYFAYPNGDFNKETISIAKECGYTLCFTTIPGRITRSNTDQYLIPRCSINDYGGYLENIAKIQGVWQKFIFKGARKYSTTT